ncbi:MAG: aspartate kinase [Gammaproteobacteria bacterium]|nr:MAG: aspartate kinase [Gammaproteobacteria bacterium]
MAVIVQKYGGTSVGSLNRIEVVAENIIKTRQQGHQVVAVISAMAGETNRLLSLARSLDKQASNRELDMLLSTGEQVSIALLAIALIKRGYSAVSLLAHQVGIITDNHFSRAHIKTVKTQRLAQSLEQEQVVLVAGFQGVDQEGNVTTLGRGGSDTSAVAIAVALGASECQIFTDVDGIYTADPRIEKNARKLDQISFAEMLMMANLGAKVLHNRSVAYAMQHNLPIRVLNSFIDTDSYDSSGTKVTDDEIELAKNNHLVSNIAHQQNQVLISLSKIKNAVHINALLQAFTDEGIELDMLTQIQKSTTEFLLTFSITKHAHAKALQLITEYCRFAAILSNDNVAKLSVIGAKLQSVDDILAQALTVLSQKNITVYSLASSDIHHSFMVDSADLFKGVHALHNTFKLNLLEY